MTKLLTPPNLELEVALVREVLAKGKTWYDLTIPQRIALIRDGRAKALSWRDIAEEVGLKRRNHSTIIQWARGKNGPPEFRKKVSKHHQQVLQLAESDSVDTQTLQGIVRDELQSTFKDLDLNNGIGLVFSANTTLVKIQKHLDTLRSIRTSSVALGEELGTTLMIETENVLTDLIQEITIAPKASPIGQVTSLDTPAPDHLLRELIDQFADLRMSLKTAQTQKIGDTEVQEGTVDVSPATAPPPPPPPSRSITPAFTTLKPPSSATTPKGRYSWNNMSIESIISLLLEIRQLSDKAEEGKLSREETEELEQKELTSEEHIDMEMRLEKLLRSTGFSWEQFETIDAINVIPLRQAAEAQTANVEEMRNALAKRQKLAPSIGGIHQADLQQELKKDATARVTWWACLACEHKFPFISTQKEPKPTVCPLCKVTWWSCARCEELFPFMTTGEELEPPVCPLCKTKEKGSLTVSLKQDPTRSGFVDYGKVVRGTAKISEEAIKNL
jgi:rubrerythrin